MKKTSKPIVFFGSGPVAAESLRLLAQDFEIEAVVTKPKPAHHRGNVPVLDLATELKLPVHTVSNKRELDDLIETKPFKTDLGVLIDFGIIVSQKVIDYFPLGIINSHFSVLPEWRGADPITFAILSGQKQTGVSLMLLVEAMDEGPVMAYGEYDMSSDITTPELTKELIELSSVMLSGTIPNYIDGIAKPGPQELSGHSPSYSRKLTKEDGIIEWTKAATQLEREIRAFIEWPKSRTNFGTLEAVITKAHVIDALGQPGKTDIIDKLPIIYCGEQALAIDKLKPAGKQEMTGEGFLAGYKAQFLG